MSRPLSTLTIKSLAGEAAFGRGLTYFRDDRVGQLNISGTRIQAEVSGTMVYQVHLRHTAKQFEGVCDCPASDNFDFCKHCVATSLKYLNQLQQHEKVKNSEGEDLLRHYVDSMEKPVLVAFVLETLSNDQLAMEKWILRAERAAGKLDSKSLKKRITRAIPYKRELYRYPQVRQYFARVEILVDELEACAPEINPDELLKLVDYALNRIARALETIDDSGGFRLYSVERLGDIHRKTLGSCGWPDKKTAGYLMDIYLGDTIDLYPNIPEDYFDVLSIDVVAALNQLLQVKWDRLPPLEPGTHKNMNWNDRFQYTKLQRPLIAIARARGDKDAEIEYLTKTAVSTRNQLQLSELCQDNDQAAAAWQWLDQANTTHRADRFGNQGDPLADQEVRLLVHEGRLDEALACRWRRFQEAPSMNNYTRLQKAVTLAKNKTDWYLKVTELLEGATSERDSLRNFSLLTEIHLRENYPESALMIAESQVLPINILESTVMANLVAPERIMPLLVRIVESLVNRTKNTSYREAIELLAKTDAALAPKGKHLLHKEIVSLSEKFKAKRNFRAWLEQRFEGTIF